MSSQQQPQPAAAASPRQGTLLEFLPESEPERAPLNLYLLVAYCERYGGYWRVKGEYDSPERARTAAADLTPAWKYRQIWRLGP